VGDTLEQIDEVTGQINQIASAAKEQTAATSPSSDNIQQISATVQTGACSSQEASGAFPRLSPFSVELQQMVQRFRNLAPLQVASFDYSFNDKIATLIARHRINWCCAKPPRPQETP
jgi:hypothetical protein